MANLNDIDLSQYQERAKTYIARKDITINETYGVEDVILMGIRQFQRNKHYYETHTNPAGKLEKLKTAIRELGGDPEDYLSKM